MDILTFSLLGFFGISLLGSLFHFVYDWTGQNNFIGLFVAVNESTWEHLKLAIFPALIWALVGMQYNYNNYAFGVFVALATMIVLIPVIFYTYSYFTKKSVLALDIGLFFVSVGVAMYLSYKIFNLQPLSNTYNIIGIAGISLVVASLLLFTHFPPKNFLFKDPITNEFGFPKNK